MQQELSIPVDAQKSFIKKQIISNLDNAAIKNLLRVFTLNVPYRFLSPWFPGCSDAEVVTLSQTYSNNCIYAIIGEEIVVNAHWMDYLRDNYAILHDYTFWNLTLFLQKRNPNVPDLSSKLVKPIQRDSLLKQRKFWDSYIDMQGSISCIYTGKELQKKGYDLDHFVPWSFVSHNLLWNLLPADPVINSSKSNNLPAMEIYLRPFALMHKKAIETIYPNNPNNSILEDYLTLYHSVPELIHLSDDDFYDIYKRAVSPLLQIAENMGFRYWQK